MFVLRPSSPLKVPRAAVQPRPAPEVAAATETMIQEPFIDRGLPLPETYDVDIIRAMLQDPFQIFIYWQVRERSLQALTRYFNPAEARTFRTTLKLIEFGGRHEVFFDVAEKGRYWMVVFPDREYAFEIGVRSPLHGYIALVRSNLVRTPRGTVSPEPAQDPEYRLEAAEFMSMLDATGFGATQSFNVTVAAVAEAEEDADPWSTAMQKLPEQVRRALMVASSGGELTKDLISELPEPLRSELMKLLLRGNARIAAVGLMHYLPELFHEIEGDRPEWIADPIRPLHLTPRFMLGGTENVALPGGEIKWPLARRPSSF